MKKLVTTLAALLLLSCSESELTEQLTGVSTERKAAALSITVNDPAVTTVEAVVSAADMDTIIDTLELQANIAHGIISEIPVGRARLFEISGYKGSIKTHYGKALSDILFNDTTAVPVVMEELYGEAAFSVTIPADFKTPVDSIVATVITAGADTLSLAITAGPVYSGVIELIPAGPGATFSIEVYGEDMVRYSGSTLVDVEKGKPAQISILLEQHTGSAEITATIDKGWEGVITGIFELPVPEGATLFMPFSSSLEDLSGNGHNGSTASPLFIEDRKGTLNSALKLSPLERVTVPDAPDLDLTSEFTISFWINPAEAAPANSSGAIFMSKWYTGHGGNEATGQWNLAIAKDGMMGGSFNFLDPTASQGDTVTSIGSVTKVVRHEWSHVAYRLTPGKLSIHINGVEDNSRALPAGYTMDNAEFINDNIYLGQVIATTSNYHFEGALDDIRIYRRALSDKEIKALYQE